MGNTDQTEAFWDWINADQSSCERVADCLAQAKVEAARDMRVRDGMWTTAQAVHEIFVEKLQAYAEANVAQWSASSQTPDSPDYHAIAKRWAGK